MRLSTRLLTNAATTYLRLGTTFTLGLFTTWYVIGHAGVIGFGLMALAVSSTGPSHALERSLRFGLVRELAASLASGDRRAVTRSLASAFRLCLQACLPLAGLVALLALLAWRGLFNLPVDQPELKVALVALVLGEGIHAGLRLLSAPFLQTLFAAQQVALDNLLIVLARATQALSAVVVFSWLLPHAELHVQLIGFAVSRATIQLADVAVGIWLAKRRVPGLELDPSAYRVDEYRAVRDTVWNSAQVAILLNILPQIMAVLINLHFGLAYNTIWQVAVQFSGFAWMLSEGLLRGIAPLTTHLSEQGRGRATLELMIRSIRYQLAVAIPAALLLGLYARPLLQVWVGTRLAADAQLAASGLSIGDALGLTASLAGVLLASQTLRAGFFGIERVLYGIGRVRSYAWFAKWATLLAVTLAAILLPVSGRPIAAPISLLVVTGLFSLGVVLRAARRETGLEIGPTLRRSLPRPLAVNLLFLAGLLAARPLLGEPTLPRVAALLLVSAAVYALLAAALATEADERKRLRQLLTERFRGRNAGSA